MRTLLNTTVGCVHIGACFTRIDLSLSRAYSRAMSVVPYLARPALGLALAVAALGCERRTERANAPRAPVDAAPVTPPPTALFAAPVSAAVRDGSAVRRCDAELSAFEARRGVMTLDSPTLRTIDTWDQDCQWRVEDLEHALQSGAPAEWINGGLSPVVVDHLLRDVDLIQCVKSVPDVPARLRVRFTLSAQGGRPAHVAPDYRVALPASATACIVKEIARHEFPKSDPAIPVIVVRAFDTRL